MFGELALSIAIICFVATAYLAVDKSSRNRRNYAASVDLFDKLGTTYRSIAESHRLRGNECEQRKLLNDARIVEREAEELRARAAQPLWKVWV